MATIAAAYAKGQLAAQLLGAVDLRWHDVAHHVSPSVIVKHEQTRVEVQAALGKASFAAAYATGTQLRLDDAVSLALAIAEPGPIDPIAGFNPVPDPDQIRPAALSLTGRQVDVLRLLVQGATDRQIAATLFLSHRTVQDHVARVIAALGVANRTEAAAVAVRDRLV